MTALQFIFWIMGSVSLWYSDDIEKNFKLSHETLILIEEHFDLVEKVETDKESLAYYQAKKIAIYFSRNSSYVNEYGQLEVTQKVLNSITTSTLKSVLESKDPYSLAYYLQGAFEVCPQESKTMIIRDDVIATFPDSHLKTMIEGYFFFSGQEELSLEMLPKLKKKLHDIFLHVIDPSYGDQETMQKLQNIHDGASNSAPIFEEGAKC